MKHIAMVGVELEGGWRGKADGSNLFEDVDLGYDGSLFPPEGWSMEKDHYGEINSPPLQAEKAIEWLLQHYPDGTHPSCGFHIHTSFLNTQDYHSLVSRRFYNHFLKRWDEWGNERQLSPTHPFWQRLEGKSVEGSGHNAAYAEREFRPYAQLLSDGKNDKRRRSHLNYCFRLHGTLECRLLPTFAEKELAADALSFYLSMIEGYLDSLPPMEPKSITIIPGPRARGRRNS